MGLDRYSWNSGPFAVSRVGLEVRWGVRWIVRDVCSDLFPSFPFLSDFENFVGERGIDLFFDGVFRFRTGAIAEKFADIPNAVGVEGKAVVVWEQVAIGIFHQIISHERLLFRGLDLRNGSAKLWRCCREERLFRLEFLRCDSFGFGRGNSRLGSRRGYNRKRCRDRILLQGRKLKAT